MAYSQSVQWIHRALGLLALAGCASRGTPAHRAALTDHVPSSVVACGASVPLPWGRPMISSTVIGTDALHGSCVRGTAPDCAFSLEVPARADLRLSLESADFDGALVLYALNRGAYDEIACADDSPTGDTHHARIEATVESGSYLLMVEGAAGETGQFSVFAELDPLPPLSATCAAARPLVDGTSLRGSTRGSANQFGASCAGGAEGPDHVHVFELPAPSRVRIRQQSEYDGALYLRSRCEDPSSELACNDDVGDSGHAMLTAALGAGRYYVFSDSFSRAQSGDYVLTLEEAALPPALSPERACERARAELLTPGEWEIDTFDAPSALSGSCGGQGAPERLFTLDLAEETTVAVDLLDAELNGVLYLRVECADERSELSCYRAPRVDQMEENDDHERTFSATIGPGRYTLGVDGLGPNDMGAVRLRVRYLAMSLMPPH